MKKFIAVLISIVFVLSTGSVLAQEPENKTATLRAKYIYAPGQWEPEFKFHFGINDDGMSFEYTLPPLQTDLVCTADHFFSLSAQKDEWIFSQSSADGGQITLPQQYSEGQIVFNTGNGWTTITCEFNNLTGQVLMAKFPPTLTDTTNSFESVLIVIGGFEGLWQYSTADQTSNISVAPVKSWANYMPQIGNYRTASSNFEDTQIDSIDWNTQGYLAIQVFFE